MHQLIKDVTDLVLDTLFPRHCFVCGTEGSFLCDSDEQKLVITNFQECIICKKPSLLGITHPKCSNPHSPDGLISFFDYKDPRVSSLIIAGKYKFVPEIYKILGTLAANSLNDTHKKLFQNFTVMPLPLASRRKRWRGFNQAEILAQIISKKLELSLTDALKRTRMTKVQKDLNREERVKNILGAFIINPRIDVKNKNILLIDDVVTTGVTLREATKVLKRNGAKKVWCLTLARD
jgi:ComF family protein